MFLHLCVILFTGEGGLHPGGRPQHYLIRSTSGRYTSYWNAFLLRKISVTRVHWWIGGVGDIMHARLSLLAHFFFITDRNEVVAKVIFLHLSVILFAWGVSASVHAGIPPPQSRPPGADPPREADSGIRSMSGRYASYWNAFLFSCCFWKKIGWG